MAILNIPNEVALQRVLVGTETVPGTPVTPTGRLMGTFTASRSRPLRRREEATGLYDRFVTPSRESGDPTGTYEEDMTFESFPMLMRYGVQGGGVGQSGPGSSYTYDKSPTGGVDDVDTATIQYGVDGMGFQATGVRWDEFNISADATAADGVLNFSGTPFMSDVDRLPGDFEGVATDGAADEITMTGAGWDVDEWQGAYLYQDYGSFIGPVRMIASNTEDTLTLETPLDSPASAGDVFYIAGMFPVVPDAQYEEISLEGSRLFLDAHNPSQSSLGTTDVSDRILSMNITHGINLARKRRMSGIIARVGRGARVISGTIRFEADRWDEYKAWEEDTELSIRWEQEGSEISGGVTKRARIDVERSVFDVITPDEADNNMTHSVSFLAYLPAGEPIATFGARNALATLP